MARRSFRVKVSLAVSVAGAPKRRSQVAADTSVGTVLSVRPGGAMAVPEPPARRSEESARAIKPPALPKVAPRKEDETEALKQIAWRYREIGHVMMSLGPDRWREAKECLEQSRVLAEVNGLRDVLNQVRVDLAELAVREGNDDEASARLRGAVEIPVGEELRSTTVRRLFLMGLLSHRKERVSEAVRFYMGALAAEDACPPDLTLRCAQVVGEFLAAQGNHKEAVDYFKKAYRAAEALKDEEASLVNAFRIGQAASVSGLAQEAEPWLHHVAQLTRRRPEVMEANFLLGKLLLEQGRAGGHLNFRRAIELGEFADPAKLARAHLGYAQAMEVAGQPKAGLADVDRALELARGAKNPMLEAEANLVLAQRLGKDEPERAVAALEEAETLGKVAGYPEMEFAAAFNRGVLEHSRGRSPQAREAYLVAARTAASNRLTELQVHAMYNLAVLTMDEGKLEAAKEELERAAEVAGPAEWPVLEDVLYAQGTLLMERPDLGDPRRPLELAIRLSRALGDLGMAADAFFVLASFHFERGEGDRSQRCLDEAVSMAEKAARPDCLSNALVFKGMLSMGPKPEIPARHFDRAIESARAAGKSDTLAAALYLRALVGMKSESPETLLPRFGEAETVAAQAGLHPLAASAALIHGALMAERRRFPEAIKSFRSAIVHATNAAEWTKVVDAYTRLGSTLAQSGETDEALRSHGSAIDVATKAKMWDDVADAHLSRAAILAAGKRPKEAQAERDKAAALAPRLADDEVRAKLAALTAAR